MNLEQSEKTIGDIREWYVAEIKRAAASKGGVESLSEALGFHPLYLYKAMKRGSFPALRRLVKMIYAEGIITGGGGGIF